MRSIRKFGSRRRKGIIGLRFNSRLLKVSGNANGVEAGNGLYCLLQIIYARLYLALRHRAHGIVLNAIDVNA